MSVEFISLINVWESSEVHPHPGGAPDAAYIRKYARYLEDGRFVLPLVRQELAHREAGAVVPQPPITPARNGSEPRKAS
jgi:hypothetical protein